jgi:hypothetical protein
VGQQLLLDDIHGVTHHNEAASCSACCRARSKPFHADPSGSVWLWSVVTRGGYLQRDSSCMPVYHRQQP